MPQNDVVATLDATYSSVTAIVTPLDDQALLLPSGCAGWSIADLLFHLTLDAQRALVALASPVTTPPDVDSVTYWRAFPGVGEPDAARDHAQWVRRSAAAFNRPSGIVPLWTRTAGAAVRAAAAADPDRRITTQDHVLTVADFLATLVTEATIHHLDLIVFLPDAAGPPDDALASTRSTLDDLALPDGLLDTWSDRDAILKGAGREPLTPADQAALGGRAALFPLIS
jgi:uncharacterized protein (TIGR03083 family)